MFGIGLPELIIILIVALLVVGPTRLPEVARSVGRALGEFRRMADDVKDTIEREISTEEEKKEGETGEASETPEVEPSGQEAPWAGYVMAGEADPDPSPDMAGQAAESHPSPEAAGPDVPSEPPSDGTAAKVAAVPEETPEGTDPDERKKV